MFSPRETIERVFYNFHDKSCTFILQTSTHRLRSILEHCILFAAVSSFATVILLHRTFVYRGGAIKSEALTSNGSNVPRMCLRSINGYQEGVDVTHIVIRTDNSITNETTDQGNYSTTANIADSRKSFVVDGNEWSQVMGGSTNSTNTCYFNQLSSIQNRLECDTTKNLGLDETDIHEDDMITFSFSHSKGLLYLHPSTLPDRNVTSQYVTIYSTDWACFSEDPWLQYIIHRSTGVRDTIAFNWILGVLNGTSGYIFNHKNGDVSDLKGYLREYSFRWPTLTFHQEDYDDEDDGKNDTGQPTSTSQPEKLGNVPPSFRWHHHYFVFKAGVLLSTLFLFFLTTTLVSFTLCETQDRMLVFTVQLQLLIRSRRPYASLIARHVVENMVFVPIMIGIVFFLMDCFYNGDKFLAFIILSGVWVCEVFSVISIRTIQSSVFFPQVFFAYFTLFHVYYFSCPFGFYYSALFSTILLLLHSMVFFWNRFELPAVLSGLVSREMPRMTIPYHTPNQHHQTHQQRQSPSPINDSDSNQNESGNDPLTDAAAVALMNRERGLSSYPSMSSLGRFRRNNSLSSLNDDERYWSIMMQNAGSSSSSVQ